MKFVHSWLSSKSIKKVVHVIFKTFIAIFIALLISLFIENIYHYFNVEIEYYKGKYYFYVGEPLINSICLKNIFAPLFQLAIIIGSVVFIYRDLLKIKKIIIGITIFLMSLIFTYPAVVSYWPKNYCRNLNSFSNYTVKKATTYFSRNPEVTFIPPVLEVIEKIPPGYSVKMFENPVGTIEIVVEGVDGRCPYFNFVTKKIILSNIQQE